MKAFGLILLALWVAHAAMHPKHRTPQRTPEQRAAWAKHYRMHPELNDTLDCVREGFDFRRLVNPNGGSA